MTDTDDGNFKNFIKDGVDGAEKALETIFNYGQIDGDHHKTWVLDQVVRALTGDKYDDFVENYEYGTTDPTELSKAKRICEGDYEEGCFTDAEIAAVEDIRYEWDTGIAP